MVPPPPPTNSPLLPAPAPAPAAAVGGHLAPSPAENVGGAQSIMPSWLRTNVPTTLRPATAPPPPSTTTQKPTTAPKTTALPMRPFRLYEPPANMPTAKGQTTSSFDFGGRFAIFLLGGASVAAILSAGALRGGWRGGAARAGSS